MRRLPLTGFFFACIVALTPVLFAYGQVVQGGPRHAQPHTRTATAATPSVETPRPGLATAPATATPSAYARSVVSRVPPFPPFPGRGRRVRSASGATVCVALPAGGTTCSATGTVPTQIIPVNTASTWNAQNLPAPTTTASYTDYVMAPDQTTPVAVTGTSYKGPTGPAENISFTKQGVYVLGALNSGTSNWDAVVYIVVGTVVGFDTYSDSALAVPASSFAPGAAVYMSATALTPTDQYVYTVENTSRQGNCVFTAPPSSPTSTLCDVTAITGFNAPGGTYTATWNTSSSLPGGTYSVSLYDRTTNRRLSQRQIAFTGGSGSITLSASNTLGTVSPATQFAFNGSDPYADSAAGYGASLTATASGMPSATTVYFTVSDPDGTVIAQPSNYSASGSVASTTLLSLGTAQSPRFFGPNIYTVTANNRTASNNPPTVLATQSIRLLGYTTAVTWGNGTVAEQTAGSPTPTATGPIVYTNDGATHFGNNADSIAQFQTVSPTAGTKFPGMGFTSDGTTCATTCTQTVTDSNAKSWNVVMVCTGAGCANTGNAARSYTVTSTPVTAGYGLAPGQTLTTPSITIYDYGSGCSTGCSYPTGIKPLHGTGLSTNSGASNIANGIVIIANSATSYGLTASTTLYGTRVSTSAYPGTIEQGGSTATLYTPRFAQGIYALNQPLATTIGGIKEIIAVNVTNTTNSSTQGAINNLALSFPSGWDTSTMTVDAALNNNWAAEACYAPAAVSNFCVKTVNNALTPSAFSYGVHSDVIYIDVDPPASSKQPAALALLVLDSPNFGGTAAAGSTTVEAGTPTTVTPLQFDVYSLSAALMTAASSPGSIGQGSAATPRNQSIGFTFQNTPTSSDANPDSIDAIVVEVDPQTTTTVTFPTTWTVSPTGWTALGTTTAASGATDYWFGLCATQMAANEVPSSTNTFGTGIAACSAATEASSSLGAGALATMSGTASVKNGTGTVTGRIYAHGANGNGWSSGSAFSIAVTNSDAATAGFSTVNGAPVASGTQPLVGGDPSITNGSSFGYTITNTGNTTLTNATVVVPGPDITGSSDQESTNPVYFKVSSTSAQITSGLSYANGGSGCTATLTQTSLASAGPPIVVNNGSIALTGCNIPAGGSVTINFNALTPSTVNSTYKFSTTFNAGNVAASEAWFSDTQLKIALGATLTVSLGPTGTGPAGSTPTGGGVCTNSGGAWTGSLSSYLDFGSVTVGKTVTCTDAILVSVATNAGGTVGWTLYVSADGNPNNNASVMVDSSNSRGNNVTYSTTTLSPIQTTGNGNVLANRPSGNAAQRTPFDVLTTYSVTPSTATGATQYLTYTFIAN